MENGSGGFLSDLEFSGGAIGAYVGNQQFTVRNLKFSSHQLRGIEIHWDWGWTWKSISVDGCPVGIYMSTPMTTTEMGSAIFIDSTITNCPVGINVQAGTPTAAINLSLFSPTTKNVPAIVQYIGGATKLAGSTGTMTVAAWGIGKRYDMSSGTVTITTSPTTSVTSKLNTPVPATPIPASESLTCNAREPGVTTSNIYRVIFAFGLFCNYFNRTTIDDNTVMLRLRASNTPSGGDQSHFIFLSVYCLSKCRFNIAERECTRIFGQVAASFPVPNFYTAGGYVESNCAIYWIEPFLGTPPPCKVSLGNGMCTF
ncbi:hypothetical protein IFR05_004467 [Cadophora sp. M221]|nr:hypothetical protein IFR05_004467 [Cadophora sp. M221]